MVGIFLFADTTLAAVSGDELSATGKLVDGQTTVVGTSLTFGHTCGEFQGSNLLDWKHGGLCKFIVACFSEIKLIQLFVISFFGN